MEEEYKDLLKDDEIVSLCSSINKVAKERESFLSQGAPNMAKEAEQEISYKQGKLRSLIFDKLHGKIPKEPPVLEQAAPPGPKLEGIEIPPISVSSLMGSSGKEVNYYTIIAKDQARKEMPDLVDAYPDHFYYAIICIEAEDGQYVKIVQDGDGEMPYYPELDQAETQKSRLRCMDAFLSKLPEKYIHAKYDDLFGE